MSGVKRYDCTVLVDASNNFNVSAKSPGAAAEDAENQQAELLSSLCHQCAAFLDVGDVLGVVVYEGEAEVLDTRYEPTKIAQLHATNQRLEGELESLGIEYVTALHGVTELRAEITELENDYKEAAADGMEAARQIHRLEGEVKRLREALEHARLFIRNGIDLGCIRMPDADTPDPAHHTLPMIDAALSTNGEVTK